MPAFVSVCYVFFATTLSCEFAPAAATPIVCNPSSDSDCECEFEAIEEPTLVDEVVLLQVSHTLQRSVGFHAAAADPQNALSANDRSEDLIVPGASSTQPSRGADPTAAKSAHDIAVDLVNESLVQESMQSVPRNLSSSLELVAPNSSEHKSQAGLPDHREQEAYVKLESAHEAADDFRLSQGLPTPSSASEGQAEQSSSQEQEEVYFKPVVSSIAARVIEIVASKVYTTQKRMASSPGIGGFMLLLITAGVWLFVMVECCKGGIHWGNPPPEEPELMPPPKPINQSSVQRDVAEVARRASERQSRQPRNNLACC